MALEKPKLTPWNEKDADKPSEFKVYSPCRINCEDGNGAKPYQRGDKVTVFGNTKRDLYFQNKIMYPKDFDAVDAYEKETKSALKDLEIEVDAKSAAASQEKITGTKK